MTTVTSSSNCSSSSSYRSSARYSATSSYQPGDQLGGTAESLFEPFLHSNDNFFGQQRTEDTGGVQSLNQPSRSFCGPCDPVGGVVNNTGREPSAGDSYYTMADVSHFKPHDVVVMAYDHHVVIRAEKVLDDGSTSNSFTHTSLFPEDMDPLSISGTLSPDGILVVSVKRVLQLAGFQPLANSTDLSEAHI